jgi:hypothetical protein
MSAAKSGEKESEIQAIISFWRNKGKQLLPGDEYVILKEFLDKLESGMHEWALCGAMNLTPKIQSQCAAHVRAIASRANGLHFTTDSDKICTKIGRVRFEHSVCTI